LDPLDLVGYVLPSVKWIDALMISIGIRALATDSLKESVFLHLGKKREKITKTLYSRSPIFSLLHWVSTVFPNA
jgi:hypothetical protein